MLTWRPIPAPDLDSWIALLHAAYARNIQGGMNFTAATITPEHAAAVLARLEFERWVSKIRLAVGIEGPRTDPFPLQPCLDRPIRRLRAMVVHQHRRRPQAEGSVGLMRPAL